MALDITFVGIKPNGKCFDFSVVGNARVDVVKFVLETPLDSLYTLEQLANFSAYCKIQSAGKEYIDKIPCQSHLEDILDKNEQVIGHHLVVELTLLKKTTVNKYLAMQLQFETSGGEIVSQTQIVALTLSGTIPADEEISDKFPYAIQILEGEVEELANEVENKVDKVSQANKVYGTDENGEQTTYDKNAFGQVEDVKVNDVSVVVDKVANINLTPYEEKSNKTTTISSQSTDEQYPSAKCVYDEIKPIKDVIPAQASEENKLTDKDFVNSSIATNTATFRGTYNIITDLGLTLEATHEQIASAIATKLASLSIVPTNNDYVFIAYPDPNQQDQYTAFDRYKYNGDNEIWSWEYELNNSSFTANQWASINSGITAGIVADLALKSGNNAFTGDNTHSGTETFSNGLKATILYNQEGTEKIDLSGGAIIVDNIVRPKTNANRQLGTSTYRWSKFWTVDLDFSGVLNPNANGYGLTPPDTSGYTANKTLAITDDVKQVADNLSDEYDNTKTYAVGDTCIYNNVLYKCTTAITTAEDFDATHWTATTVAELVADETIITLDTGTYSANTPMSANDLAVFQPLLNMNVEEATKYLKNKMFLRLDSSRNETQSSIYASVRAGGQGFDRAWYDIQISFGSYGSFTLTPTRLENGTY